MSARKAKHLNINGATAAPMRETRAPMYEHGMCALPDGKRRPEPQ